MEWLVWKGMELKEWTINENFIQNGLWTQNLLLQKGRFWIGFCEY